MEKEGFVVEDMGSCQGRWLTCDIKFLSMCFYNYFGENENNESKTQVKGKFDEKVSVHMN